MCDDVVEARQVELGRRRKIGGMEADVGDSSLGREAARVCDVRRHRIDPEERQRGWVAARRTALTPWPQPRSHQAKPCLRAGGAQPWMSATWSSQAGATRE